jgi:uridine monophosphate synthetase
VEQQYTRGPLRIAEWAHIVNAHLLPGPDIISALHAGATHIEQQLARSVSTEIFVGTPEVSEEDDGDEEESMDNPAHHSAPAGSPPATARPSLSPTQSTIGSGAQKPSCSNSKDSASVRATTTIYQTMEPTTPNSTLDDRAAAIHSLGEPPIKRALILLAQMSNKGNRADKDYTAACVTAAKDSDFVIGFVAQEDLNQAKADNFLTFTPGVNLPPEGEDEKERRVGDGKGQQYRTPREVLGKHGCDVVIVGRGIIKARDRPREANRYRREAWKAYEARLGGKQNGHAKKK